MALFENYERRIDQITAVLNQYGIKDIEEAEKITTLDLRSMTWSKASSRSASRTPPGPTL